MYPKTKVYSDGRHYIAIPHTENPYRRKRVKPKDEIIEVPTETEERANSPPEPENVSDEIKISENINSKSEPKEKKVRKITKRQLFDETYKAHYTERKAVRRKILIEKMLPYFKDRESAATYVDAALLRKYKNFIARRIRMTRKANLADFKFFCNFYLFGRTAYGRFVS